MDTIALIVIIVSIFLIALASVYFIGLAATTRGLSATPLSLTCPPSQCATNVYNGEKVCPAPGATIEHAPFEVCNSRELCDNNITPYAVMPDGSTRSSGICETGQPCRCVSGPRCPEYILTTWNTTNGNPYTSLRDQSIVFVQRTAPPPISYVNALTTFCAVPPTWLSRSTPGCEIGVDIKTCVTKNPCLTGVLAYLPGPDGVVTYSTTPVACVRGTPCTDNKIAVWDNQLGAAVCS